jgi:hypothetical protein
MYQVRTEKDYAIRTYTADSYFDAVDLFHNLSKVLPFVQVWQGDEMVMEYDPRKEEHDAEIYIAQHYMK